ncbi:MAG TPA: cystathionine gamma-synthase [Enteractinococcus helveticum]|uniref:Cystathionine gamma-synthase n=1 Tax=Enteractinococcus helveticum TaxID=1837282 RepID=A0A921FNL3_9MICC|nr:cystathionine gamma-synthase [Enteractinococcus helveticum]HJF15208.1 cystathionine gamma-synthase [Enteractinococcus helveticum]
MTFIDKHTSGFNTRAVHAGQELDPVYGAVVPPIHLSSTYAPEAIGKLRKGYDYGRGTNPTRDALQAQIAGLETGNADTGYAYTFSSGLASETALLMATCKPGDRVVVGNDVYGGTYRLLDKVLGPWELEHHVVDMSNLDQVREALASAKARILWVETPTNPMMKIADIAALAELAKEYDTLLVVDNTFATPYLQLPLQLGADVVVHSTTKYMGGHSDTIGGAVVTENEELANAINFQQYAAGASNSPLDSYLVTRGLKTLGVRMDRHVANATAIAQWLTEHPGVEKVHYPGLEDHPGHEIAKKQMSGFGGMVSVQFKAGVEATRKVAESTHVFRLAESLGGVESLLNYPTAMTHASVEGTELAVPGNLIRLSVGIEDLDDLIGDLEQALQGL